MGTTEKSIPANWIEIQLELSKRVSYKDAVDFSAVKYVAGVDISFHKTNERRACAFLCVLDFKTLEVVYQNHRIVEMVEQYVSGFLAFREVNHYVGLINTLRETNSALLENCVILVDGFGVLHERKCGLASHLGVEVDLPTIGVAKNLVLVDNLDERHVKKQFADDESLKLLDLVGGSGTVHGVAFRSAKKNPIYISIGHKVSLESAVKIVQRVCRYRIPEPIRIADNRSKLFFDEKDDTRPNSDDHPDTHTGYTE